MAEATPGNFKVISVRALRCHYLIALLAGLSLGMYTAHSVFYSGRNTTIARALVDAGDYLCRQWDGLAEIGRVSPSHYAFRCHSLAVFPQVKVTIEKEQK